MGIFALFLAICAFICSLLPFGMYIGMGLGGWSAFLGMRVYRSRITPPWFRLAGAFALTIGVTAAGIAITRVALTWWAVSKLIQLI